MKHLLLTLGTLRDQERRIKDSIATIEILLGQGAGSNGHGPKQKRQIPMGHIKRALGAATEVAEKKKRGPYRKKFTKKQDQARPLPEVKIPNSLDTSALDVTDAIVATLKAMKRPLSSGELTAAVLTGGFKVPESAKRVPITRYVAIAAGNMARHKAGVKKGADGWVHRG